VVLLLLLANVCGYFSSIVVHGESLNKPLDNSAKDVRLLVKHVSITSDLGEYGLPTWASWVKVIIDGKSVWFDPDFVLTCIPNI
jgi:hypothetical protein